MDTNAQNSNNQERCHNISKHLRSNLSQWLSDKMLTVHTVSIQLLDVPNTL